MPAVLASGLTARPFAATDTSDVLELINADRLPGQPLVQPDMLADALAGRCMVDAELWAEIKNLSVDVITDREAVVGVISYATRSEGEAGLILWLHALEDETVVGAALDHAMAALDGCVAWYAFDFATALSLGLEALPVRHRPVTHQALQARGFYAKDMWRYMWRSLPVPEVPAVSGYRTTTRDRKDVIRIYAGERAVGEAEVSVHHQIGVLWWLHVEPAERGRGVGRDLLGCVFEHLSCLGAREVILFVDDDAPGGVRDRGAANRLYDRSGFTEVDRLHCYWQMQIPVAIPVA